MKNTITVGTEITTIYGYEKVTAIYGYNVVTSIGNRGSIVYTDSYVIDEDGNPVLDGHRMLTLGEIAHLMKEVDGHQHSVFIEEETAPESSNYYIINDSPLEGYGDATIFNSMEHAAAVVEEHLDAFKTIPTICEYDADDEFTGYFWEYIEGEWREWKV